MRRLKLSSIVVPEMPLPHLKHFYLEAHRTHMQPTIDNFFRLNPQIEILKLYHCFYEFSTARILQHLPDLQDLDMHRCGFEQYDVEDKVHYARLKHLKRLRIRSLFDIKTVSLILQALLEGEVQLETLILKYLEVDEFIDDVCRMQTVTKLEMDTVNGQHIIRLIEEMQNLKEIIFESRKINYENIRDALKITPNNKKITFRVEQRESIEPIDVRLFEEIDTIRRERNIRLAVQTTLPVGSTPEHIPVTEVSFIFLGGKGTENLQFDSITF